jgi:hypothetical protein
MTPPGGWLLALEKAQADGYSAAFYPEDTDYETAERVIFIWIYKNDSLTFNQFISQHSSEYIRQDSQTVIIAADSLYVNDSVVIKIFEFDDPGGISTLAEVAYIDLKTEIVIYELNIADRESFITAEGEFLEALRRFSISSRGADN